MPTPIKRAKALDLQALLKAANQGYADAIRDANAADLELARATLTGELNASELSRVSERAAATRQLVSQREEQVLIIERRINEAAREGQEAERQAIRDAKRDLLAERVASAAELEGAATALMVAFARFVDINRQCLGGLGSLPVVSDVPEMFNPRHLQTRVQCRLVALSGGVWEPRGFSTWDCQQMPTLAERAEAESARFLAQIGTSVQDVDGDSHQTPPEAA